MTGGTSTTISVPAGGVGTASVDVPAQFVCQFPETVTFETDSAFVEPTPENKSALTGLIQFISEPRVQDRLLLVGHTDSPGDAGYNLGLSERRARSVLAVLTGDAPEWEALFNEETWGRTELRQMVIETGEADPADPNAVDQAVNNYLGAGSAGARAGLFTRYFERLLGTAFPPAFQFVDLDPPWLGCGEQHLLTGSPSRPGRDPAQPPITGAFRPNRRVEFFFFEALNVSVPIDCDHYPQWTLACAMVSPAPLLVDWFVSASTGQDAPGFGVSRDRPFRTIQFAVDHVDSVSIADTDVINVMDGTYRENITMKGGITLKADSGAAPILERAAAGSPVILCNNVDSVAFEELVIDGRSQEDHGISILFSGNVRVERCQVRSSRSSGRGGGILVEFSEQVEIKECTVSDNQAPRGGGIAVIDSSQVTIESCRIERNQAGTIDTALVRVDINLDLAPFDCGDQRGVEIAEFDVEVGDGHGGGIYLEDSSNVFIRNNPSIQENRAILFGGGIAIDNEPGFSGTIVIEGNELTCNQTSHEPLAAVQPTGMMCNDDMGDPLFDPFLEVIDDSLPPSMGIGRGGLDEAATDAIRILHGVGIENGLGGGIALRHVSPETRLVNNIIGKPNQPNRARRGGGIECYIGAYPLIEVNTIDSNLSSDDGGGIAIDEFDPFLPAAQPAFLGLRRGAFFPRQIIQLVSNQILNNASLEDGGGLYATGNAQVMITGATLVQSNRAAENGGGIRISYATNLTAIGARIIGNQANIIGNNPEGGGGLAARNAAFELRGCELSDNVSNRFAGGAIFCTSVFEGGFNQCGPVANQAGQLDQIMEADYNFHTRSYRLVDCRGANNRATGASGAGGFLYALHVQANERLDVSIEGAATRIEPNTSEYNNPRNPGGAQQKRGNVVAELSPNPDAHGLMDSFRIFGDVPASPVGIAPSTPAPNDRPVVVIHGGARPDDHPTTFPYSNIALAIIDVQPRFGPIAGGAPVTITGAGFLNRPGTQVLFGGQQAGNVQVLSGSEITVETPPLPAPQIPGPVDVEVRNADGQVDTIPGGYEYANPPSIIDVQPRSGPASGGTPVTVTGTGFRNGAQVEIAGVQAVLVVVVSDTQITAVTPPLPVPMLPGLVDITVENSDGQSVTVPLGFEYLP